MMNSHFSFEFIPFIEISNEFDKKELHFTASQIRFHILRD